MIDTSVVIIRTAKLGTRNWWSILLR